VALVVLNARTISFAVCRCTVLLFYGLIQKDFRCSADVGGYGAARQNMTSLPLLYRHNPPHGATIPPPPPWHAQRVWSVI